MGIALCTILGCLSQLERELIRERVVAGMKNARAKGIVIGRVRKRNSVLIESLLEAGLSFREIARISKSSHGSVSAQKKEWLAKKAAVEKQKFDDLATELRKNPVSEAVAEMKAMNLPAATVEKIQHKFESEAREKVKEIQGEVYETFD
jgi:hypothetical protein